MFVIKVADKFKHVSRQLALSFILMVFEVKKKWPIASGLLRYVYSSKLVTSSLETQIVRIEHYASGTCESQYGRFLTNKGPPPPPRDGFVEFS
jgi:hypothetical protein